MKPKCSLGLKGWIYAGFLGEYDESVMKYRSLAPLYARVV